MTGDGMLDRFVRRAWHYVIFIAVVVGAAALGDLLGLLSAALPTTAAGK
jgi:hypothetical protein